MKNFNFSAIRRMREVLSMLGIMFALSLIAACSSDSDNGNNNGNGKPGFIDDTTWTIHYQLPEGDIEGCPNWKEASFFDFENTMTAIICFDPAMSSLISNEDRLAVIIDGEARDIANIVNYKEDEPVFMMLIPFEADDDKVELQYYNAKKNQTYIIADAFSVWDDTVGSEDSNLFYICLTPKVNIVITMPDNLPFLHSPDDKMGIFCGDVCCGLPVASDRKTWVSTVYRLPQLTGTKAHVRYYSAEKEATYTTDDIIDLSVSDTTYAITFK